MNLRVNDTLVMAFQNNELYLDKQSEFVLPDTSSIIGVRLGLKNPLIFTIEFHVNATGPV